MYTQLFGGYLLNHGVLTADQLAGAMEKAKETRVKLGVLAINAGYMTAEQVDECHCIQFSRDKRLGDIAVEQGYMTENQVEELLKSQKSGYLVLGQAIMNQGYLDNVAFEKVLADYKKASTITESDFLADNEEKAEKVLNEYYGICAEDAADGVSQYISLLMKNLVRFIGSDFSLLRAERAKSVPADLTVMQPISGVINLTTALCTDKKTFLAFGSRYAKEEIEVLDEYAKAAAGEFMNLNNGLFTVNMSQQKNIELELEPQEVTKGGLEGTGSAYIIPVQFSFGIVRFVVASR